jgi:GGDEF domain-containing protein
VVLAVGNAVDSGAVMQARLQDNLRGYNVREKLSYRLSLGIGIVRVDTERAASIEEVLKQADQAMYEDKRSKKEKQRLKPSWNNEFA